MSEPNCGCLELDKNKGEVCATCKFGMCPRCSYPNAIECHRHAPTGGGEKTQGFIDDARWPMVSRMAWCGDYVLRSESDYEGK